MRLGMHCKVARTLILKIKYSSTYIYIKFRMTLIISCKLFLVGARMVLLFR